MHVNVQKGPSNLETVFPEDKFYFDWGLPLGPKSVVPHCSPSVWVGGVLGGGGSGPTRKPPPREGRVGPTVGQPRCKREIGGSIPGAYEALGERTAAWAGPMCR